MKPEDDGDAEQSRVLPAALAYGAGALVGARLGPGGAIIGAFSGPYLEIMLRRSFAEFAADAKERVRQMMGAAREKARCTDAELEERLLQSERTRLLNITAIEAAADTTWPPKVVALGRVLADGVTAEEESVINLYDLALAAMADMERPHVVLLDLLVRYEPEAVWQVGWKAVQHRMPSYVSRYVDGGEPFFWSPGHRVWTADQICDVQPKLRPALMGLLGTIERHGLARLRDSAPTVAKQITDSLDQLRRPKATQVDPSWSPTELGEQVRAFYDEAATGTDTPPEGERVLAGCFICSCPEG